MWEFLGPGQGGTVGKAYFFFSYSLFYQPPRPQLPNLTLFPLHHSKPDASFVTFCPDTTVDKTRRYEQCSSCSVLPPPLEQWGLGEGFEFS